ncbi:MAG: putative Ig domain-containing protein [Opitutaceae bacterium]|nr:putative Ig domain-containing protein [Opitutaceae bacterium]
MVAPLAEELREMERLLVADGWEVVRGTVSRTDSVPNVKAEIKRLYDLDPPHTRALYLFGHIPVPYSGELVPDGHNGGTNNNHRGAWPADVFYADLDGIWTDTTINCTVASHGQKPERNHNIPGDGKYDQSHIPSPLELETGRVDLANLPKLALLGSETELLRNYIRKNHRFRHKEFAPLRRALLHGTGFDSRIYRPSADLLREASGFFGPGKVTTLAVNRFMPTLQTEPYLWAHGDGGGSWEQASGVGTTSHFSGVSNAASADYGVIYDPQCVFFTIFGSWFGDWDTPNNYLRAFLASPTGGLTNIWVGFGHWFAHDLALGYPIGRPTRLLQENLNQTAKGYTLGFTDANFNANSGRVHLTLMGDPTLRLFVVAPPRDVHRSPGGGLTWTAPEETAIVGYHVYWAAEELGRYLRLTDTVVADCRYQDPDPKEDGWYMIRAVKLETTGSGSFYNPSVGIMVPPTDQPPAAPVLDSAGNLAVRWPGAGGHHYRIEDSTDLHTWSKLNGEYAGTGTDLTAIVRTAAAPATAREFWRVVSSAFPFFAIAYPEAPLGKVGTALVPLPPQLVFANSTHPTTYKIIRGALPAGLALDPTTGIITGTPTAIGARSATIRAANGSLDAETVVRIAVIAAGP